MQSLEKRRLRNDLVLTHKIMNGPEFWHFRRSFDNCHLHKIIFHQIDLEESNLIKFSIRPGLRRSSLRLLQQTGRTRRRRNSFACRVVKYWNRLPLAVASAPYKLAFKRQLDTYIYPYVLLLSLFSPQYGLLWAICPFPVIQCIHTV